MADPPAGGGSEAPRGARTMAWSSARIARILSMGSGLPGVLAVGWSPPAWSPGGPDSRM